MGHGLEALTNMEYPGRFIIAGRDESNKYTVIIYGITARSEKSKAREIRINNNNTLTVVDLPNANLTNEEKKLMVYPAIMWHPHNYSLVVSNGLQTEDLFTSVLCSAMSSEEHLFEVLNKWDYEPDPSSTPRIAGCVYYQKAALSIIKKGANGLSERQYFSVPVNPGHGKLICTYSGDGKDPLTPFSGEPKNVDLTQNSPRKTVELVQSILKNGELSMTDYSVSVAAVFIDKKFNIGYAANNKQGTPWIEGKVEYR